MTEPALAHPQALEAEIARLRARTAALEAEAADRQTGMSHLAAEQRRLLDERTRLAEENTRLTAQAAQMQADAGELLAHNERLRAALAEARAIIEDLTRQVFGAKADRLTPEQEEALKHILKDLKAAAVRPAPVSDEVLAEADQKHPATPRPRRPRQPIPTHLEIHTVTIEPEDKACGHCGRTGPKIGEEVTEELDVIPARLICRRTIRPKYARGCECDDRRSVAIAPLPPRLIPQSLLGTGLAVHILLSRYDDHLSFYRLAQQFAERHQVVVPRQQMVQWVEHIAVWLQPIYDAMWNAMLATGYLQVDETPVRVLDPDVKGKSVRGYLWFYAVPGGDVLLDFDRHRSLAPVQRRLTPFAGTIQTDAYEVYQALERQEDRITRIGCLAHVRRRFYGALRDSVPDALWYINHIRGLYRIEDDARGLDATARFALREVRQAIAIWLEMKTRALELQPRFLPKSKMGDALQYFLNDYDALVGYLRDGRFEIDNNLVENSIRPTAVGRRRWLFIGHPDAGWRSAVIYSILVSCRRRGINPDAYLTDVLRRLPSTKITDIASLLPANWKPPSPNPS
jgi:transposase